MYKQMYGDTLLRNTSKSTDSPQQHMDLLQLHAWHNTTWRNNKLHSEYKS